MKVVSFDRSSLKREVQILPVLHPVRALKRLRATSYSHLQLGTQLATGHTALCVAFILPNTVFGKGTLNKFRSCSQWRSKLLKPGGGDCDSSALCRYFYGNVVKKLTDVLLQAGLLKNDGRRKRKRKRKGRTHFRPNLNVCLL
jgi:hypothetical protein